MDEHVAVKARKEIKFFTPLFIFLIFFARAKEESSGQK